MSILRACQCSPRVGMKLFTSLSVCARLIDKQFPSFLENPHKGFPYQYPDYLCFVGNQSRYDLNAKMHWGKSRPYTVAHSDTTILRASRLTNQCSVFRANVTLYPSREDRGATSMASPASLS